MKKAFITFLAVISAMIMFTACGSNGSNGNDDGVVDADYEVVDN